MSDFKMLLTAIWRTRCGGGPGFCDELNLLGWKLEEKINDDEMNGKHKVELQ